jgi:hypothetical protein
VDIDLDILRLVDLVNDDDVCVLVVASIIWRSFDVGHLEGNVVRAQTLNPCASLLELLRPTGPGGHGLLRAVCGSTAPLEPKKSARVGNFQLAGLSQ